MAELMSETDVLIKSYLNAVAGNLVGETDANNNKTTRYLTDWTTWGYYNWNNMSTRGTWVFDGGRWGFSPNDESLERPAVTHSMSVYILLPVLSTILQWFLAVICSL